MAVTLNASASSGFVTTADTSTILQLQTNGTTAVTVDASQNVGIGTASPSYPLDVQNAITTGVGTVIGTYNTASSGSSIATLRMRSAGTGASYWDINTGNTASGLNGSLRFFDNIAAAERMRIDSSGNVGIGTSSPRTNLDVAVASTDAIYAGGTGNYSLRLGHNNTQGQITSINAGTSYTNLTLNSLNTIFQTGSATLTERMRIDSSGNLLVGTTDTGATTGTGIKLLPAGDAAGMPRINVVTSATTNAQNNGFSYYSTGAAAYRFYVGAGGTISATSATITALSDQRLKENIRDLDDGLASIMALKPRKFDWKEGKGEDKKDARGFIAQEFETVFPDLIDEWLDPAPEGEEPYKGVNANLIPTLVKAIQEQQALIQTLTDRITALEGVK